MRFHIAPRDVPPAVAARRMGMTLDAFLKALPAFKEHGFPTADPVSGNFDLQAIDRYCDARNPRLFRTDDPTEAVNAKDVVMQRLAAMREKRA